MATSVVPRSIVFAPSTVAVSTTVVKPAVIACGSGCGTPVQQTVASPAIGIAPPPPVNSTTVVKPAVIACGSGCGTPVQQTVASPVIGIAPPPLVNPTAVVKPGVVIACGSGCGTPVQQTVASPVIGIAPPPLVNSTAVVKPAVIACGSGCGTLVQQTVSRPPVVAPMLPGEGHGRGQAGIADCFGDNCGKPVAPPATHAMVSAAVVVAVLPPMVRPGLVACGGPGNTCASSPIQPIVPIELPMLVARVN
jgi:hypothetical protein